MSNIQQTVVASAQKAQYDLQVKKLLGSKEILSHVLVKTVDEFKGLDPGDVVKYIEGDVHINTVPVDPGATNRETGDKITGLNTEDGEINEGYIRYDIIFYVLTKNGRSKIIVNIEAQKSEPDKYYLLNRGIFYASRMISSQKERDFVDMNYNDLHQVYSIWICCGMKECCMSHIHLTEDVLLGKHEWQGNLDLFNVVMIGLTNDLPEKMEDYEMHRLLGALLSMDMSVDERLKVLTQEYNIGRDDETERRLSEMCNLSEGVMEYGMKIGIEQGIETGRAEANKKTALRLYKLDHSVDEIADILEVSVDEVEDLLGLVKA